MGEAATTAPRRPHKEALVRAFLGMMDAREALHPAQRGVESGATTRGTKTNAEIVIRLLNEALDTAVICILRYKRCQRMATEIRSRQVKALLLQHVTDAQGHADQLAERIVQLGGTALLPLERLRNWSHGEQIKEASFAETITAILLAERSAIRNSRRLIASVGTDDPATRQMLEQIIAQEEAHAENLASLL